METRELGRRSSSRWSGWTEQSPGRAIGPQGPARLPHRRLAAPSRWDSGKPPPSYVTGLSEPRLPDLPAHRPRPRPHLPTTRAPGRKSRSKQPSPPRSRGREARGVLSAPPRPPGADRAAEDRGRREAPGRRSRPPAPPLRARLAPLPHPRLSPLRAVTAPHAAAVRAAAPALTSLLAPERAAGQLGTRWPVPSPAAAGHEGLNAAVLRACLAHPRPRAPPCAAPPPAPACLCLSQTGLPLPLRPLLPPPLSLTPAAANSAAATSAILAVTEGVGGGHRGPREPIAGQGQPQGAGPSA